jgi:class 3 adenylate cyclase
VLVATESRQAAKRRLTHQQENWTDLALLAIPVIMALFVGRLAGGLAGALAAVVLMVIGMPVMAFTRNQMLLTDSGRRLATTVDDVAALKSADAEAFTRLRFARQNAADSWTGQNGTIFFADIAAFSHQIRLDPDRLTIRRVMYTLIREAFESAGVSWQSCHREDRGDGVLVIVPPSTPTGRLVDPLVAHLATSLAEYNRSADAATRIQLRVALHVGPVMSDPYGVSGESIIQAARLLDAPVLKRDLAASGRDLGLIVSPFVHDFVVKHLPAGRLPGDFHQVRPRVKESELTGWVCLARPPGRLIERVPGPTRSAAPAPDASYS